jgi:ABC transport system ATP-binding/permease protein
MALISMQGISLAFIGAPVFDEINLTIERGEKVGLVGRNGAGKSTLLRLIEGSVEPDSGTVSLQNGAVAAYLSQEVPQELPGTVFDVIASGSRGSENEWFKKELVDKSLSQLGLDGGRAFSSLSAGLKRQVLLKKALVGEPDILLLDEPTNHMDIDSIRALEQTIVRFPGALIFVTHDRMFLQKVATRIVDIDRGRLFDQTCDYETFLVRRDSEREAEETKNALFDKKLKQEEQWVRQGIKARRTRNEGRVRELEKMRVARSSRRDQLGKVKMEAAEAERSGTLVVKADDIGFNYGDAPVISKFSTSILKGDRIGILGPNGSGKTTLLRLLLGELGPVTGTIRLGANLQISYSDQLLEQLDETKTAFENVGDGGDTVTVNGRTRHIFGYLQDFLFTPDQARSPVSVLSGGERRRLMLACLFTRPSNLLVLDEPTNDLDIETLDLLEELLMNYTGTILLVSHDRTFINNIATSTIAFEGDAVVKEYVGGYDDWLRQRPQEAKPIKEPASKGDTAPAQAPKAPKPKVKLSFREQKELDALPETIESIEKEQHELFQIAGDPELYKKGRTDIVATNARLEELQKLLTDAYDRWEQLEQLRLDAETNKLTK